MWNFNKHPKYYPLSDARKHQGTIAQWRAFMRDIKHMAKRATPAKEYVLSKQAVITGLQQASQQDSLTWLGHASFLLKLNGKHILFDPFLGKRASPLTFIGPKRHTPPALVVDELPPIDIIMLSHNHYDHLCVRTLKRIRNKQHCQVIVPKGLGAIMRSCGYKHITELGWYQSHIIADIKCHVLPAYHYAQRGLFDRNAVLWGSLACEFKNFCIFFGGDTTYGSEFKKIGQYLKHVSHALIGIGAFKPRELMQHAHACPEEGLLIAHDLKARIFFPMHWGSIVLTPEDVLEPITELKSYLTKTPYTGKTVISKMGQTHIL